MAKKILPAKTKPAKILGKPYSINRVGQVFDIDGQKFRCTGFRDYEGAKGVSRVADLATTCADCGAGFVAFAPVQGQRLYLARRCPEHRAKGKPVNPTKAQRMAQYRAIASRKGKPASIFD